MRPWPPFAGAVRLVFSHAFSIGSDRDASTNDNDQNMLIIRGENRVADICFTEFNRRFNPTTSARCGR
jgi:hypothetical protein